MAHHLSHCFTEHVSRINVNDIVNDNGIILGTFTEGNVSFRITSKLVEYTGGTKSHIKFYMAIFLIGHR